MDDRLQWRGDVPVSTAYGDVYYDAADGLAESRHVFWHGNRLGERIPAHAGAWFHIGETGFGTGLNFLMAWQAWDALPDPKPGLHFLSTELHPLPAEAMERALAAWPELAPYARALLAILPPPFPGMHRRYLGSRVTLDLLQGDAAEMLAAYAPAEGAARVDAWFLDGFAPAKNPGMWTSELYERLAALSAPDATLATFTAAGHVRRGLEAAGFAMQKIPGFGRKREMLVGRVERDCEASRPSPLVAEGVRFIARSEDRAGTNTKNAIIIGGGIAGCGAAWRLARQGREVILLEAGESPASGASGNPAAAFTPYFSREWDRRAQLTASGFAHTAHLLEYLRGQGHPVEADACGVLMLAADERSARLVQKRSGLGLPAEIQRDVDAAEASELAGIPLHHGGLHYPQGGWLNMESLCRALLADSAERVTLRTGSPVGAIRHDGALWQVTLDGGETLATDTLVLACGMAAKELLPALDIRPAPGETIAFDAPPGLAGLKTVLHWGHYLTPAHRGRMVLGSTYPMRGESGTQLPPANTLAEALGAVLPGTSIGQYETWRGIRATTPQRLPLIGPAAGQPEGLYLHLAHGSRGSLTGLFPFAAAA